MHGAQVPLDACDEPGLLPKPAIRLITLLPPHDHTVQLRDAGDATR